MWSYYINPQTGDYEAADGRLVRVSRALGKTISATTIEAGSVPSLPEWGCDLTTITHLSSATPRKMEAEVDRALRPMLGVDLVSYERGARVDAAGVVYVDIRVTGPDGGEEKATIEVAG